MPRTNQRGSKNNNPEGRNQYSNGWMDTAKDRPITTAAAAAAAVGAGVFLWSRRNQISDQISSLSDQISDWRGSGSETGEFEMADAGGMSTSSGSTRSGSSGSSRKSGRSTTGSMGEIGGGNASLGAHSGGSGTSAGNNGRARA